MRIINELAYLIHPLVVEIGVEKPVGGDLVGLAAAGRLSGLVERGGCVLVQIDAAEPLVVRVGREVLVHEAHGLFRPSLHHAHPRIAPVARIAALVARCRIDDVIGVVGRVDHAALVLPHDLLQLDEQRAFLLGRKQVGAKVARRQEESIVFDETRFDLLTQVDYRLTFAELSQV